MAEKTKTKEKTEKKEDVKVLFLFGVVVVVVVAILCNSLNSCTFVMFFSGKNQGAIYPHVVLVQSCGFN